MKMNAEIPRVYTSGELSRGKFGVSALDQAHILSILRDKLYSDKILAVIREYTTNGTDAHVEAGKPDLPIYVTLPQGTFSTDFKVRDFGFGLSEEDIYNVFTKYGRSTKRNSDEVIGQLGLGSKSGFAYANTFTITSWHNGTKSIYSAYIDPSRVGRISKLSESPSGEPSGLEIHISVRPNDRAAFLLKATNLFAYFRVRPRTNVPLNYAFNKVLLEGENWKIWNTNQSVRAKAVMGDIAYPLNAAAFGPGHQDIANLMTLPLSVEFPIGALAISASREALEYTEETKKALKDGLAQIAADIATVASQKLNNAQTLFEARCVARTLNFSSLDYRLRNVLHGIVHKNLKWRGQSLRTTGLSAGSMSTAVAKASYFVQVIRPNNEIGTKRRYYGSVPIGDHLVVFLQNTKSAWKKKAATLRSKTELSEKTVLLVVPECRDNADFCLTDYIGKEGIDGIPVYKLDDVTYVRGAGGTTVAVDRSAKLSLDAFVLKKANELRTFGRVKSDNWDASTIDPTTITDGYYLEISRFNPIGNSYYGIKQTLLALKVLGYDTDSLKIYGFRPAVVKTLGKNWTPWNQAKNQLLREVAKAKTKADIFGLIAADNLQGYNFKAMKQLVENEALFTDKDSPALVYCRQAIEVKRLLRSLEKKDGPAYRAVRDVFWKTDAKDTTPTFNFAVAAEELSIQYPLLSLYGFWTNGIHGKAWADTIINYINLRDTNESTTTDHDRTECDSNP